MYNMIFKAIFCNEHNTDIHPTDDYMVALPEISDIDP